MNQLKSPLQAIWPSSADTVVPFPSPDRAAHDHLGLGRFGLGDIEQLLRRNGTGLALWVLACLVLAGVYLYQTPPQFAASTQVVLEPRRGPVSGGDAGAGGLVPSLDSAQADSQVQVIKSERNLRFVFDTLNLQNDPTFADPGPGLVGRFLGMGPSPESRLPERRRALAFQNFIGRVGVRRIAQSYVLEVSFVAPTPGAAARLANAVTAAYIRDQILFRAASVQRGMEFLQGRVEDIKAEQDLATEAVRTGAIPDAQFADSDARVVSAALEPLGKAFPQTRLVLLFAGLLGLFSGGGFIALRHSLDRTIRSRGDIVHTLGLDLLCALPRLRGRRSSLPLTAAMDDPSSSFALTMRALRASLFSAGARPAHLALGILSCSPREGRTTIASNLAFLLAGSHEPTVLVDGDLLQPALTDALAPTAPLGLSDLLMSHAADPRFPEVSMGRDLAFVPAVAAGRQPDPNVFLGTTLMQQALMRARSERNVIVDLPPLSLSPDAQAIGRLLDGVILVVEVDRTTLDDLTDAVRALRAADTRLMGVVLNKMPSLPEKRRT